MHEPDYVHDRVCVKCGPVPEKTQMFPGEGFNEEICIDCMFNHTAEDEGEIKNKSKGKK